MTPCPACSQSYFEDLVDFGVLPRSGVFLNSPKDPFPTVHLAHEFCATCGLIRQKSIEAVSHDYSQIDRATTRQFPKYIDQIVGSLASHGVSMSDLVLEIGSNDGGFLERLEAAGYTRLIGVEPSISCAEISQAKGHVVEVAHWDEKTASAMREKFGPFLAVICRHTLEHVPDPLGFLQAIRTVMDPKGIIFIEVPDARPITHDLRGHELWDEHLHIFSATNLSFIMRRAGFSVTECIAWPERSDINLLLWAKASGDEVVNHDTQMHADMGLCRQFKKRWTDFSARVLEHSANWRRPVAMIGASHPQSNYVHFTGLDGVIDMFVDDDQSKRDKYIPLSGAPIVTTGGLHAGPIPGTLLRGAFGYDEWMDRAMTPFVFGDVEIVCPYAPRFLFAFAHDHGLARR